MQRFCNDGLHLISELQVSSLVEKFMYWCSFLAPFVWIHTHLNAYSYMHTYQKRYCKWWFTLDLWTSGKFNCWETHVLMLCPCTLCSNTHTHSSMQILVCICFGYCKWWFTLDLWTSGKFLLTSTCADALSLYLLFEYFYMQHIFICISVLCIKLKIR